MSTRRGFERRFLCGLLPDMALHAMLSEKLIERVYPEIDRNLGELLPHAERHVVVSDHIVRLWTEPFRSNPSRTTGTRTSRSGCRLLQLFMKIRCGMRPAPVTVFAIPEALSMIAGQTGCIDRFPCDTFL